MSNDFNHIGQLSKKLKYFEITRLYFLKYRLDNVLS